MKFEELLTESYSDFEVAIHYALMDHYGSLINDPRTAKLMAKGKAQQFKEYANNNWITGREKDVGYWTKQLNTNTSFITKFNIMLSDIEETRIPDYEEIPANNGITFYRVDNFAAARKLCTQTRWCIFSDSGQFDSYGKKGNKLYMAIRGNKKFMIEWNKSNQDFGIWNANNDEIEPHEFMEGLGTTQSIRLQFKEEPLQHIVDMINAESMNL